MLKWLRRNIVAVLVLIFFFLMTKHAVKDNKCDRYVYFLMKIYLTFHSFVVHIILKDNLSSQDENHFPQDAQVRKQHRPEYPVQKGPLRQPQPGVAARGQLRRQVRPLPPEGAPGDTLGEGGAALRHVRKIP